MKRLAAPAALVLAALAVWLSLPDKVLVFDGVMFAQIVDRSIDEWRSQMLNPRHLLFNPFFQFLRDALSRAGLTVEAYRLFQEVNALAGAAGLLLFGDLARRLSRDAGVGWCAALLLGATWCYGARATEGQVYMLMSLGAIAFLWAAVRLLERPSAGGAALAVGAAALGALFHAADAFLFPAAAAALWLAFPKRRAAALSGAAAAPVLIVAAYALAFGSGGLREFFGAATDFRRGYDAGFWPMLFAKFWTASGAPPWVRLTAFFRDIGGSLAPMPGALALPAGLALGLGAGAALFRARPRLDSTRRAQAVVLGTCWAGFATVNIFWPGGWFFHVPDHACALALLALAAGPSWAEARSAARRLVLGAAALAGLATACWTVRSGLVPASRIENNPGYRTALFVGAHTEASSFVVVSGLGFANSKVYLPKFAHRTREVLEYYFDRNPKDAALREFAGFSARLGALGIPMYLLSDLAETPGAYPGLKDRFGVSAAEIEDAMGPGRVVRVAAGPDERVYLFVPRAHRPELFAVLGYSLLTDDDRTRLGESVAAITEIARGMSPAERRRAGVLMREKNWGFDLLWEGFAPIMSAESAAAAREHARTFAEFRKTPDFWLRAGNLYGILGLKAETVDAWTRAQKMSGDGRLLKRIEEFKKSP
ncbi:MAG: hypothetical protein ACHQ49_06085 [Elusimicrobiota bacterium]